LFGRSAIGLLSLSAGTYGAIAISAVISILLSRTFGAAGFGHLSLLLVAAQWADLAVSSWTLPFLIRSAAQEWSTRGSVGATLVARTILLGPGLLAAALVAIALAGPIMAYLAVGPVGLGLVVAFFLATGLAQTGGALLRATDRMARQGTAFLLEKTALLVLLLLVGAIVVPGPELALACYAAAAAIAGLWALASIGRRALVPVRPSREELAAAASFSLPLVAGSWAGLFGNQAVDYVVIRTFLPLSDLGLYAIAYQSAGLLQQSLIVVSSFLLPRFVTLLAAGREDELHAGLGRLAPHALLVFSLVCGLMIVVAPFAVPLVFGPAFAGAVPPLRWLIITAAVFAVFSALNPLLIAHGIVWPVARGVILAVALNVALDILLVPAFGVEGAAAATLASYAVSTAFVLIAVHRRLRIPVIGYPLFVIPPAAVAVLAMRTDGPALGAGGLAILVVAGATFVRAFGLFSAADRLLLARAWRS